MNLFKRQSGLFVLQLFSFLSGIVAAFYAFDAHAVRVLVSNTKKSVVISGSPLHATPNIPFPDAKQSSKSGQRTSARVELGANDNALRINGNSLPSISFASGNGLPLYVDGKAFHGKLMVYRNTRGILLVNDLDIERYVEGVASKEVPSSWPIEAIKAQAVIARTFALKRIQQHAKRGRLYDVESSVLDQVYGGHTEHTSVQEAVRATSGTVLTFGGKLIEAFYHSCCGGMTTTPEHVWRSALPYYRPVPCPYCTQCPSYFWKLESKASSIVAALHGTKYALNDLRSITVAKKDASGRNAALFLRSSQGEQRISGDDFRRYLGYGVLKSTHFTANIDASGSVLFRGSGSGHGLGLCQWGAKNLADQGKSFREILSHYYPKVAIDHL